MLRIEKFTGMRQKHLEQAAQLQGSSG